MRRYPRTLNLQQPVDANDASARIAHISPRRQQLRERIGEALCVARTLRHQFLPGARLGNPMRCDVLTRCRFCATRVHASKLVKQMARTLAPTVVVSPRRRRPPRARDVNIEVCESVFCMQPVRHGDHSESDAKRTEMEMQRCLRCCRKPPHHILLLTMLLQAVGKRTAAADCK